MTEVDTCPQELCGSLRESRVFDHYAYGDPQPHYARYVGEDGPTEADLAIPVYIACQREMGHPGKHLAHGTKGWD